MTKIQRVKINIAKAKKPIINKIEQLEKEIQNLKKCISKKRDKIEVLSKDL